MSQRSLEATLEAVVEMKFTYVVSCQNYGAQKRCGDQHAADVLSLMMKWVSIYLNNLIRFIHLDGLYTFMCIGTHL